MKFLKKLNPQWQILLKKADKHSELKFNWGNKTQSLITWEQIVLKKLINSAWLMWKHIMGLLKDKYLHEWSFNNDNDMLLCAALIQELWAGLYRVQS